MIVRAPWIIPHPGTVREQIALNIDIAPTFLELAGIDPPVQVDGESEVDGIEFAADRGAGAGRPSGIHNPGRRNDC